MWESALWGTKNPVSEKATYQDLADGVTSGFASN